MKTIFSILAAVGTAILLWSVGENDNSVYTSAQMFLFSLAGLGLLGIGLALGHKR